MPDKNTQEQAASAEVKPFVPLDQLIKNKEAEDKIAFEERKQREVKSVYQGSPKVKHVTEVTEKDAAEIYDYKLKKLDEQKKTFDAMVDQSARVRAGEKLASQPNVINEVASGKFQYPLEGSMFYTSDPAKLLEKQKLLAQGGAPAIQAYLELEAEKEKKNVMRDAEQIKQQKLAKLSAKISDNDLIQKAALRSAQYKIDNTNRAQQEEGVLYDDAFGGLGSLFNKHAQNVIGKDGKINPEVKQAIIAGGLDNPYDLYLADDKYLTPKSPSMAIAANSVADKNIADLEQAKSKWQEFSGAIHNAIRHPKANPIGLIPLIAPEGTEAEESKISKTIGKYVFSPVAEYYNEVPRGALSLYNFVSSAVHAVPYTNQFKTHFLDRLELNQKKIDSWIPAAPEFEDKTIVDEGAQMLGQFRAGGLVTKTLPGFFGLLSKGRTNLLAKAIEGKPVSKIESLFLRGLKSAPVGFATKYVDNYMAMHMTATPIVMATSYAERRAQGDSKEEAAKGAFKEADGLAMIMPILGLGSTFIKGEKNAVQAMLGDDTQAWVSKRLDKVNKAFEKVKLPKVTAPTAAKIVDFAKNTAGGALEFTLFDMYGEYDRQKQEHEALIKAGEIPADAPFELDGQKMLKAAEHGALMGTFIGGVHAVKEGQTDLADPIASGVVRAIEDPNDFTVALQSSIEKGRITPEKAQEFKSFIEAVKPAYEKNKKLGIPVVKKNQIVGRVAMQPEMALTLAVKETKIAQLEQAIDLYRNKAQSYDPAKIRELSLEAARLRLDVDKIKAGTYTKGSLLTAKEVSRMAKDYTDRGLKDEQRKQVNANGAYKTETVKVSEFKDDETVKSYLAVNEVKDQAEEYTAKKAEIEKKLNKISVAEKLGRKLSLKEQAEKESLQEELRNLNQENKLFSEYSDILGFDDAHRLAPVVDSEGKIIDGRKRVAAAIIRGDESIEVLKPLTKEETDSMLNEREESASDTNMPDMEGTTPREQELILGARLAYDAAGGGAAGVDAAKTHIDTERDKPVETATAELDETELDIEKRRQEELDAVIQTTPIEVLDEQGNVIHTSDKKVAINAKYDAELEEHRKNKPTTQAEPEKIRSTEKQEPKKYFKEERQPGIKEPVVKLDVEAVKEKLPLAYAFLSKYKGFENFRFRELRNALSIAYNRLPRYRVGAEELIKTISELEDIVAETEQLRSKTKSEFKEQLRKSGDFNEAQLEVFNALVDSLATDLLPDYDSDKESLRFSGIKKGDDPNFYTFADNILAAKSPDAFVHEIGHFAFMNVLSKADRLAYLNYMAESTYGVKGKSLRDRLAMTSEKVTKEENGKTFDFYTNVGDNFSEYFAEQFRQWYLKEKVTPSQFDKIFEKVEAFLSKVVSKLKSGKYVDKNLIKFFEKITSKEPEKIRSTEELLAKVSPEVINPVLADAVVAQPTVERSNFKPNKILKGVNQLIHSIANKLRGNRPAPRLVLSVSTEDAKRLADAYEAMKHDPDNPEVKRGFEELVAEIKKQADALLAEGYTFELTSKNEGYGSDSDKTFEDVKKNKRILIESSEESFGTKRTFNQDNIGLQDSGYKDVKGRPLTNVELIRAVHDLFGHSEYGNGFGAIGEENAWRIHMSMFSPLAQKALTATTRGQNSWVNFGKHMRNEDGSIKKKGDPGYIEPSKRPFAEQKIGFLPDWATDNAYGDMVEINGKTIKPVNKYVVDGQAMYSIDDPKVFRDALLDARENRKQNGKNDWIQVHAKTEQEYRDMLKNGGQLLVSKDGKVGIAVGADGFVGSGFAHVDAPKGALVPLLNMALKLGARYTDAYDTYLPEYYTKFGFKVAGRMPFDESLAEKGWEETSLKDKPDVVFMYWDGGDRATIDKRFGEFPKYDRSEGVTVNSYEEGVKLAKDKSLELEAESSLLPVEPIAELSSEKADVLADELLQHMGAPAKAVAKVRAAVDKVKSALRKIAPGLEVKEYATPAEAAKAAEEAGLSPEEVKAARANGGWFDSKTNTIHLNMQRIQENTLFHEAVHPVLNAIAATKPEAIDSLFNQLLEIEKRQGLGGKYSAEFASQYEAEQAKMEALTEFIADVANGTVEIKQSNFDKIKQLFVDMMKSIGIDLSGKIKTIGDLKEIAEQVAKSFETGEALAGSMVNGDRAQFQKRRENELEIVNGFYSPIEKRLLETKVDKQSVNKWLSVIGKGDEAKWTGVRGWLESLDPQQQISKSAIQNWMADNRIEVKEISKSEKEPYEPTWLENGDGETYVVDPVTDWEYKIREGVDSDGDVMYFPVVNGRERRQDYEYSKESVQRNIEAQLNNEEQTTGNTSFSKWQLEGEKENYKEILVTLPSYDPGLKALTNKEKALEEEYDIADEKSLQSSGDEKALADKDRKRIIEELGEVRLQIHYSKTAKFQSSHFEDNPNIAVHLRMNTRMDAEGNKVLFLEEVQSDWGQEGREKGFNDTSKIEKVIQEQKAVIDGALKKADEHIKKMQSLGLPTNASESEIAKFKSGKSEELDRIDQAIYKIENYKYTVKNNRDWYAAEQEIANYEKQKEAIREEIEAAVKGLDSEYAKIKEATLKLNAAKAQQSSPYGTPSAPFVTKTTDWVKLGLKVALKEAVKQGADKIAWTTGEQQIDRYDLSTQVDFIDYRKNADGTYYIDTNHQGTSHDRLKENELEGVVGKEVAEKIIKGEGKTSPMDDNDNRKRLEGLDLKVGGKGMKAFYGSPTEGKIGIVGDVAKSVFKQEPKTVGVEINRTDQLSQSYNEGAYTIVEYTTSDGIKEKVFNNEEDAEKFKKGLISKQYSTQHSIDITPELKADVEQGLPLFQRSNKLQSIREFIEKKRKEGVDEETIRKGVEIAAEQLGIENVDALLSEKDSTFGNPRAEYEQSQEGLASKRAKTEAKLQFVEKYFKSIESQLMLMNKIKRKC